MAVSTTAVDNQTIVERHDYAHTGPGALAGRYTAEDDKGRTQSASQAWALRVLRLASTFFRRLLMSRGSVL